jgi:hypothetical protein
MKKHLKFNLVVLTAEAWNAYVKKQNQKNKKKYGTVSYSIKTTVKE